MEAEYGVRSLGYIELCGPDGSVLEVNRIYPTLSKDAYPTLFPNQPSYLSTKLPLKRKTPEERENELDLRCDETFRDWCKADEIKDYKVLTNLIGTKVEPYWEKIQRMDYMLLLNIDDNPKIVSSVKIKDNLEIEVFFHQNNIPSEKFTWILGEHLKCDRWTKLDSLLSHIKGLDGNDNVNISAKISSVSQLLLQCIDISDDINAEKIRFLSEQVELLSLNQPKYSPDTIVLACSLFYTSPSCYRMIRNSKCLTLSHPSYLRKLSLNIGSPSSGITSSHQKYLCTKSKMLKDEELLVNLLLDEIYVKPSVNYKSGKVVGFADNDLQRATTVQCFMISSIFSKNRDVVAMFPVKNLNANYLLQLTKVVINFVQVCGFRILTIISDNNKVNRNMFQTLCGGILKFHFENPIYKGENIYILFDTVHILKSVRNNWLNQTQTNQTFIVPSFQNDESKFYASLLHLKAMYDLEKEEYVKLCPALCRKALFPSTFERQNVTYAAKLFDEKTVVALGIECQNNWTGYASDIPGTIHFMDKISKWWQIVNVKHSKKGFRSRDPFSDPVISGSHSLLFLKEFGEWLKRWDCISENPKDRSGKLSLETQLSLSHTTLNLINIAEYILKTLKKSFVLFGKFQTENLEARFGQYRQMSGANYHVSVTQILESERKLKLVSIIKLISSKKGEFSLNTFSCDEDDNLVFDDEANFIQFEDVSLLSENINVSDKDMMSLIYIAGYVARTVLKKNNCDECKAKFISEKDLQIECQDNLMCYLENLDRGGLKWPTEFTITIVVYAYQVFQVLISDSHEKTFLAEVSQKNLLVKIISDKMYINFCVENMICACGVMMSLLIHKCAVCISNILLNNYCKVKNEKHKFAETKAKKPRKTDKPKTTEIQVKKLRKSDKPKATQNNFKISDEKVRKTAKVKKNRKLNTVNITKN